VAYPGKHARGNPTDGKFVALVSLPSVGFDLTRSITAKGAISGAKSTPTDGKLSFERSLPSVGFSTLPDHLRYTSNAGFVPGDAR
jgi:hypothetical protein